MQTHMFHPLFQKDHQIHHHLLSCLLLSLVLTHTYILGSGFFLHAATNTDVTTPTKSSSTTTSRDLASGSGVEITQRSPSQMEQMIIAQRAKMKSSSTITSTPPQLIVPSQGNSMPAERVSSSNTSTSDKNSLSLSKDSPAIESFMSAPINPAKTVNTLVGLKVNNMKVYAYKDKYIVYWPAPKKPQNTTIEDYIIRYKKDGAKEYTTYIDGVHNKNYAILSGLDKASQYDILILPKATDTKGIYSIASTINTSQKIFLNAAGGIEKNQNTPPNTTPATGTKVGTTPSGILGNSGTPTSGGNSG